MAMSRPAIPSNDDMNKGLYVLLAELAVMEENFSEAARCYQMAATLNANLGRYDKSDEYLRLSKYFADMAITFARSN